MLERCPGIIGAYFMELLFFVLGPKLVDDVLIGLYYLEDPEGSEALDPLRAIKAYDPESVEDSRDFAEALTAWGKRSRKVRNRLVPTLREKLLERSKELSSNGATDVEKRFRDLQRVFDLNSKELELLEFLFIHERYDEASSFFGDIMAMEFRGRRYLAGALGMSVSQLQKTLNGKLATTGFIEFRHSIINPQLDSIDHFLCNDQAKDILNPWYKKVETEEIPLSHHFVDPMITAHLKNIMAVDPAGASSTHTLIYGPPGCGKTTYAHGVCRELGLPAWEIKPNEDARIKELVSSIWATINTKAQQGVIICDDADRLLNAPGIWRELVESVDKRMAHAILEHPGVRMIWICNEIMDVDPSVMRRFSYSIRFRPFRLAQRKKFLQNLVDRHCADDLLNHEDIESIASKYTDLSPGIVESSVRKAAEVSNDPAEFRKALELGINSHYEILSGSKKRIGSASKDSGYSLDALNLDFKGGAHGLMAQIMRTDQRIRRDGPDTDFRFNLLFFGGSGTGKSALARHISEKIDRELVAVRASDILSKWVGDNEKNIRLTFEKAKDKGAILLIDELDGLSWGRERAERSWESGITSELLQSLEDFCGGIFIGTTNRLVDLDPALLRRFSLKVEFSPLEKDQALILYRKLLQPLSTDSMDFGKIKALSCIPNLCPGDFRVVKDRFSILEPGEVSHEDLMAALQEEVKVRRLQGGQKAGIGFMAG
jgi:SpoVK/Ycf46/Vps4 family AAA+-type ATPase